jgi:hypothetical protein
MLKQQQHFNNNVLSTVGYGVTDEHHLVEYLSGVFDRGNM